MAERGFIHIVLEQEARAAKFTPPGGGRPGRRYIPPNRKAHGQALLGEMRAAEAEAVSIRSQREAAGLAVAHGLYVAFEGFPGFELALESLENRRGKNPAELIAVRTVEAESGPVTEAVVYIPDGKLGQFLGKLEKYLATSDVDKPGNAKLLDHVGRISLASLRALWTDAGSDFPSPTETVWWEIWLRRTSQGEYGRAIEFLGGIGAEVGARAISFPDRTVLLARTSAQKLSTALGVLDDLAELRRPRQAVAWLANEPPSDQAGWVADLLNRATPPAQDAPAVCLLDTGLAWRHPLLAIATDQVHCQASNPAWGSADDTGHGTQMAGLALYEDLESALTSSGAVALSHGLESVKVLPPPGGKETDRALWGAVTADATAVIEAIDGQRRRLFSMTVTAPYVPGRVGEPTLWSATLDALACGLQIDRSQDGLVILKEDEPASSRLFIQAVGNVAESVAYLEHDHITASTLAPVEDPAQAWNALAVGAFTDLDTLPSGEPMWEGYTPLAPHGELSPHSRTSSSFPSAWPIKPDVVAEGGNVAESPAGAMDLPDDLQILTTNAPTQGKPQLLTMTHATSAATSVVAAVAAKVMAAYPSLRAETVRALVVHSAKWTPRMTHTFDNAPNKTQRLALLRRYGMGVPDPLRATRSASDSLTLVTEQTIHPFEDGKMRELHMHDLPWPIEELAALEEARVQLRVTLSYFIEPNPGSRGWKRRYKYASHGLRFEVKRQTESPKEFERRINLQARAEDEGMPRTRGDAPEWLFGSKGRSVGSLHTDIWSGAAADLASKGAVAVYPVMGWWKERADRDGSERGAAYSLVVSIEAPGLDVDIYTPVAAQVGIPIEI